MSPQGAFWDARSDSDHLEMATLLAPLILASQNRNFMDKQAAKAQTYTWRLSLADVPKPIVAEAIAGLVAKGVTWMPKPGEVKAECAKVQERKRQQAYLAAIPEECPTCGREKAFEGARWKEVTINGVARLAPCDCRQLALQAAERAGQAIALPPAPGDSEGE